MYKRTWMILCCSRAVIPKCQLDDQWFIDCLVKKRLPALPTLSKFLSLRVNPRNLYFKKVSCDSDVQPSL